MKKPKMEKIELVYTVTPYRLLSTNVYKCVNLLGSYDTTYGQCLKDCQQVIDVWYHQLLMPNCMTGLTFDSWHTLYMAIDNYIQDTKKYYSWKMNKDKYL